jgi:RES domain-containing protein
VTPLPPPLGSGEWVGWRLDEEPFAPSWDSGEGAFIYGGRWNEIGQRAVYCALDPATAIIEVAVHKGFDVLDKVPHVLTRFSFDAGADVKVVAPGDVPNPNWLRPVQSSAGQQAFGGGLLQSHAFVLIPSAASTYSWNLIFTAAKAAGRYRLDRQERFALDTRLHPASKR